MVHFQSLDWAGHRFLYFHAPERFPGVDSRTVSDEEKRTFKPTVAAFHEYVDGWLGRFLARRGADTGVMILSDHGMEPAPDQPMGAHDGAPPGILVMNGPGIPAGARIDGATVYDILPTLLAGLRLPVARDLPGRLLAFAEPGDGPSSRQVQTYGRYRSPHPTPAGVEAEQRIKDEFRALGNIR